MITLCFPDSPPSSPPFPEQPVPPDPPGSGSPDEKLFLYLVLNKAQANLAMARRDLRVIEQEFFSTVPDPYGDRLALAVVVNGPQRALDRVRKRLEAVSVDALTAGPSMTRRPLDRDLRDTA